MTATEAISAVIRFEGGYANDPSDPGGATAFGISSRYNPSASSRIRAGLFTRDDAVRIYRKKYWAGKPEFFVSRYPVIAFLLFDASVSGHKEVTATLNYTLRQFRGSPPRSVANLELWKDYKPGLLGVLNLVN